MLRTAWVVVRRTVRMSSPPRSMVRVWSATWTVTICPAWMRPRAIFCPTMITPVLLATRCTVTGSAVGRGGGPVGVERLAEQLVRDLGVQVPQHPVVGHVRWERPTGKRRRRVMRRRQKDRTLGRVDIADAELLGHRPRARPG